MRLSCGVVGGSTMMPPYVKFVGSRKAGSARAVLWDPGRDARGLVEVRPVLQRIERSIGLSSSRATAAIMCSFSPNL